MNKVPELLAPAGSMEKLRTVLKYGADAVYLGGKAFNLRAQSSNFSMPELKEAITYTHSLGKKVYVALNIIAHDRDIKAMPNFVKYLQECGVDAVIVADLGIFQLVQEASDLPIHISTQASVTNFRAVSMWQKLGAKRIILARELSLLEIRKIRDQIPNVELEVFVHGAMCMAYSGRCQLSSYMSDRDGNHGLCTNTCRWKYSVVEETRPGEYFQVYEDETGSYIFNSKDLCTVEFLNQIIEAGVDGLKIEGRNKSLLYGSTTVKTYREAIDSYASGQWKVADHWMPELQSYTHRGYTTGFFHGQLPENSHATQEGGYLKTKELVGIVTGLYEKWVEITLRNRLRLPSPIEIVTAKGMNLILNVETMSIKETGSVVSIAQNSTVVQIPTTLNIKIGDIVRQDYSYRTDETKGEKEAKESTPENEFSFFS